MTVVVITICQFRLLVCRNRIYDNHSSVTKSGMCLAVYAFKLKLTSCTEKVEEREIERER